MNKPITKLVELAAATAVGLAIAAMSGSCRTPGPRTGEPPRPLAAEQVKALVDNVLPTWDGAILAAKDGPAWSAQLDDNLMREPATELV